MPSTASEWLAERPGALAEFEEMLVNSGLPLDVLTEYPDWMKQSVADRLVETFEQPYWGDIAGTFSGDAERWLQAGLRDGLSIRQMAQRMAQDFAGGSYKYAVNRAMNIARTEAGHALNGARKDGMNRLMADVPEMGGMMRPVWLSVLGTTTRDSHAALDGVPADKDGMWELSGYRIPWPGHISLPASERCNCQCTIGMDYGLQDDRAQQLIDEYYERVGKSTKHLQGRHNQLSHGRGGGGGVAEEGNKDSVGIYSLDRRKLAVEERVAALQVKLDSLENRREKISKERQDLDDEERQWELMREATNISHEIVLNKIDQHTELFAQHAVNLNEFLETKMELRQLEEQAIDVDNRMMDKVKQAGGGISGDDWTASVSDNWWNFKRGDKKKIEQAEKERNEEIFRLQSTRKAATRYSAAMYYGEPVEVHDTGRKLPPVGKEVAALSVVQKGGAPDAIKRFMAEADVGIKTDLKGLEGIVHNGVFKNHFHRGTSGVGKEGGRARNDYRARRREGEQRLFGISRGATPDERPIYGYLENSSRMMSTGCDVSFGNMQIMLKDSVKGQTTYTVGDSLDDTAFHGGYAGAVANPRTWVPGVARQGTKLSLSEGLTTSEWKKSRGTSGSSPRYIEAQVHGKVGLGDIKAVRMPASVYDGNGVLIKRLESKGVHVDRMPEEYAGYIPHGMQVEERGVK